MELNRLEIQRQLKIKKELKEEEKKKKLKMNWRTF